MSESERWKSTEWRQFLLYTGLVVLRDVLSPEEYNHFVSLSVAMSILLDSDDRLRNYYLNYAKQLLRQFVLNASGLYGDTFVTYNVHS